MLARGVCLAFVTQSPAWQRLTVVREGCQGARLRDDGSSEVRC